MSSDERIRNRRSFRTLLLVLGLSMTAFFVGLGVLLLFNKGFLQDRIPEEFRNIFAIMVLVYGVYRGWRVYADYFQAHPPRSDSY